MLFSIIHWYLRQKQWEGCLRTLHTLAELINRPGSRRWGTSHSAAPSCNSRMNTEVLEHQSSHPCPFGWGSQCQHSECVCVWAACSHTSFFTVSLFFSSILPSHLPFYLLSPRLTGSWGSACRSAPLYHSTLCYLGCDFLCSISELSSTYSWGVVPKIC